MGSPRDTFPDPADAALAALLGLLAARDYHFVTITPASHARVLARPDRGLARTIEDALGWNLPFAPGLLSGDIEQCLRAGGMIAREGELLRGTVRVSWLGDRLYLHSAYPTLARDAVFFGPDSYRFADLIAAELARRPAQSGARAIDIGCGAGVGALTLFDLLVEPRIVATDINPQALRFTRINADGAPLETVRSAGFENVEGSFDLITINPPYIIDGDGRSYRHGGGLHGGELALDLAGAATTRLSPGGRVILYTGSAIVGGRDGLRQALAAAATTHGCTLDYREIDPDIFGEELSGPAYADVDRIALVAAIISRR